MNTKVKTYNTNGSVLYDGEVNDGTYNGMGTGYYSNGSIMYKGEWLENIYNGMGTLYSGGFTFYKGEWLKCTFNGIGTMYDPDDGSIVYEGKSQEGNIK